VCERDLCLPLPGCRGGMIACIGNDSLIACIGNDSLPSLLTKGVANYKLKKDVVADLSRGSSRPTGPPLLAQAL
jgi:hypothetical protein